MTYTLNNVPDEIDRALRARAASEHKSPEQAILDALARDLGVSTSPEKKRDLSAIAGTWEEDPEFDAALEDQRRIDWELWQETEAASDEQDRRRDLSGIAGLRLITEEMKAAFEEQRRIDPELWK